VKNVTQKQFVVVENKDPGNCKKKIHINLPVMQEDTKGIIIIFKSRKDRQHNGQKKKYKRTNNDLQNIIHIKHASQ
jgi:hypothetical protein